MKGIPTGWFWLLEQNRLESQCMDRLWRHPETMSLDGGYGETLDGLWWWPDPTGTVKPVVTISFDRRFDLDVQTTLHIDGWLQLLFRSSVLFFLLWTEKRIESHRVIIEGNSLHWSSIDLFTTNVPEPGTLCFITCFPTLLRFSFLHVMNVSTLLYKNFLVNLKCLSVLNSRTD